MEVGRERGGLRGPGGGLDGMEWGAHGWMFGLRG